jgi:iron-sulfur cluster repair protein YtfE (RIC family)
MIIRGEHNMAAITPDMKVGEIVRNWPGTMKVFRSRGLDLKCGGVHSLAFAAGKHGFNLETMLAELNASADTPAVPSA